MITMSYFCACGYSSGALEDAQLHANTTQHHIDIKGFITPTKSPLVDLEQMRQNAAFKRAREAAILRAARDKGLLK